MAEVIERARETRRIELSPGALARTPTVFASCFPGRPALVVADANTLRAAGQAVLDALCGAGREPAALHVFRQADFHAEHRFVALLEEKLRGTQAVPIAVGAGSLNDVVKLAAHRTQRPYLCVPTAASMDGYTAFGASITFEASKQTFSCPAPAAVVADLDVVRLAPGEMNSWGYADLAAKFTAGADWILADALGVEPIHPEAWSIVQSRLRSLLAAPAEVREADPTALRLLLEGLLLGGFAMQAAKSSRAASGSEHQFSHLWDMQRHTHKGVSPAHGLKVGIGTLAIIALYEQVLNAPLQTLRVERLCAAWPSLDGWVRRSRGLLANPDLAEVAARELAAKHVSRDQLRDQLALLRRTWPALRDRLREQLLPFDTMRAMLRKAGAAVDPVEIGISRARLKQSFWQAFCLRRRFTVLDLAVRTGILDPCLEAIFSPHGCWPLER